MGLQANKTYKKSARVVGDVIGKYHPHGDAAVYEAIVRMAQDFSMRQTLVDGQGNFGSLDGDPPAAMRYTEVRMTPVASELMADIEKETVDFAPNYDGTLYEPLILPARVPNLLLNGASGIAVGMATNIPPHNLGEIIDGLIATIENPDIATGDLAKIVPGPDFPTGGLICGTDGIKAAHETGRGSIQVRARTFIEKKRKGDRECIVISELPYQINKSRLIERIADLVKEKKVEGISDIRDESDREGVRVVIELKRDEITGVVLNQLYQHTQMQTTFGVIMLAIVENQPRVLGLRDILQRFIDFRKQIVTRRTLYDLKKAEARAHILEGLKVALGNLDRIISLIRKAASPAEAKEGLMSKFKLSEVQAQAILDMRLQRLTALERDKITDEYKDIIKSIEKYRQILASEKLVMGIITQELRELKEAYGEARRTEIIEEAAEISIEDLVVEEEMVVAITHRGYIKRNPISLYRAQRRGGKGVTGITTREEDFVECLFTASTHHYILFFTDFGKVYWQKVYEIPQAGRVAMGKALVNLLKLAPEERVAAIVPVKEFTEGEYVLMATERGVVKKTPLTAYSRPRSGGIIALLIDKSDRLISAEITDGNQDILLSSKKGKSIRFTEEEVRPMGRATRGVKGMVLTKDDTLVGMDTMREGTTLLTVTEKGYGKRTKTSEYRVQGRGGMGIITIKTIERNGNVVGIKQVVDDDELMLLNSQGKIIRIKIGNIPVIGRNTQGVRLIDVKKNEKVVGVARIAEKQPI
jgi:DNA gyrase subunit A